MTSPEQSVHLRLLENATDEQLAEATALAVRAFSHDPIVRAMTGDRPALKELLFAQQLGAARVAGRIYVVSPLDKDVILAVAVWFPPGTAMIDSPEQRAAGNDQFVAHLDPATKKWWDEEYKPLLKKADDFYGEGVILNSWYAYLIATDPAHQRKGYGSMLVREGFKLGMEDKAKVALAAANKPNADWYTSLGFKPVGTLYIERIDLDPTAGFTCTWLLCEASESFMIFSVMNNITLHLPRGSKHENGKSAGKYSIWMRSSHSPLTTMTSKTSPLSLNDTLRDLALLRACDVDLTSVLSQDSTVSEQSEVDMSVDRSYEFAREARAALKLLNRGEVDKQGARVEDVRNTLEDVTKGLEGHP